MSKDALAWRLFLLAAVFCTAGATYRTPNFIVTAPTPKIAEQVGKTAEIARDELAVLWLGKKMPRWYKPCTIKVKVGQIGAGGATTFAFDRGEVFGWRMTVQGTLERILDSVIPHEVSHTVFASHFRRPLPRWADEGAATLIEHESERRRQQLLLGQVWNTSRKIPLRNLLAIKEYPSDMNDVMTLYAEGHSLADFLVQAGGRPRFLAFLDTAHNKGWDHALRYHYKLKGVSDLDGRWNKWVMAGSPKLNIPKDTQLASGTARPRNTRGSDAGPIIRSQSPDNDVRPALATTREAARGGRLEASNPKRSATAIELPRTEKLKGSLNESPGWQRAVADGWTSADHNVRETPAVENDDAFSASKESRFRESGPGERSIAKGRSPNWSGFPRTRTSGGQEEFEEIASPFSP